MAAATFVDTGEMGREKKKKVKRSPAGLKINCSGGFLSSGVVGKKESTDPLFFSFFNQSAARYLRGGKERKNSGARSQTRLFLHWIIARLSACVLEPRGELFK